MEEDHGEAAEMDTKMMEKIMDKTGLKISKTNIVTASGRARREKKRDKDIAPAVLSVDARIRWKNGRRERGGRKSAMRDVHTRAVK